MFYARAHTQLSQKDDLDSKEGFIHGKPWTTEDPLAASGVVGIGAKEPMIHVDLFFREFLDVYFEEDKTLYDVLLVQVMGEEAVGGGAVGEEEGG